MDPRDPRRHPPCGKRRRRASGRAASFFLTDGSTCGITCSLPWRTREKIIVNRNAHKSVFNACEVMKIEPVVLNQNVIEGVMVPPSADDVEKNWRNTRTRSACF
ncbi:MAG: hypothetical protein ACLRSW_17105 [Christensenellaceae bacterium]